MSETKRKAKSVLDHRPNKKQQTSSAATVEHVSGSTIPKPIIATTPGAIFPQDVRFQAFTKNGSELLLHSSDHPTIDYTAVEGTESNDVYLKHYIAVFHPETNQLKLAEAKRLTVRGAVRGQKQRLDDSDDEDAAKLAASQSTRAALTEAFGSKKSKKAVQSMAENRQLGQGVEGATIADAITAKLEDEDEDEDALANIAINARSNKPLPRPNLSTDDIEEVYGLSKLIVPSPATNTLRQMPIDPWTARLQAKKEVGGLRSRFVAHRISYIGKRVLDSPDDSNYVQQLQLLRYVEHLVQIAQYINKQGRHKRMDFVDKWPPGTTTLGVDPGITKQIVNHFFPENTATDRATTLLKTTIFALTLHILPPSGRTGAQLLVTEPSDIQLDLAMELGEVKKLFHELGCTVKPVNDKDLILWGYTKLAERKKKKREDGGSIPKPVFAVLKFPLDFPKASTGKRARK